MDMCNFVNILDASVYNKDDTFKYYNMLHAGLLYTQFIHIQKW